MKIHKSTIQDFALCPKRTKSIWIDGLRLDAPAVAKIGLSFHKMVPEWFNTITWEEIKARHTLSDIRQYFKNCFPIVHHVMVPLIYNFVEFELLRYTQCRNSPDLFFPLEQEYYIETPNFAGTIDAIFKVDDQFNCVHEWKTGRSFYKTSLRRELGFYCIIGNATKYKGTLKYISVYNSNLDRYMFETLSGRTVSSIRRWIEKFNKARKTNVWPRKITGACRGCPMWKECLIETVEVF